MSNETLWALVGLVWLLVILAAPHVYDFFVGDKEDE